MAICTRHQFAFQLSFITALLVPISLCKGVRTLRLQVTLWRCGPIAVEYGQALRQAEKLLMVFQDPYPKEGLEYATTISSMSAMSTKPRNPKKSKGIDPTRREGDGALDIFSSGKFRSIKVMVSEAPEDAELAQSGSVVRTHYTAWLLAQQPKTTTGQAPELTQALIRKTKAAQPFDSTQSTKRSRPFTFRLGDRNVFEGCK